MHQGGLKEALLCAPPRMVSGGHSDPYEVCLPCAGGHQDVHCALCSAMISKAWGYAQEGTHRGVHSRSFPLLLACPQTGPKPTLSHFSASIILPPSLIHFLFLLIVLAEYLGSPTSLCAGSQGMVWRAQKVYEVHGMLFLRKTLQPCVGALLRQAILMASHTRPCVCRRW